MHRESGSNSEVDPIVKLIWSKVCITIFITISITNLTTIVAWMCRGSYRGVPGTIQGWKAITLSKSAKLSQGGSGVKANKKTLWGGPNLRNPFL